MPISHCPACNTIRPPNATFCPMCGAAFDGSVPARGNATRQREVDLSFWTAIRFGAGFAVGASLVAVVFWAAFGILILIGIGMPSVR